MSGSNNDGDAGFPDFEPAKPVNHPQSINWELLSQGEANRLHGANRHRFVRFVFEIKRSAPAGIVAHDPLEHHHSPVGGSLKPCGKLPGGNGIPG